MLFQDFFERFDHQFKCSTDFSGRQLLYFTKIPAEVLPRKSPRAYSRVFEEIRIVFCQKSYKNFLYSSYAIFSRNSPPGYRILTEFLPHKFFSANLPCKTPDFLKACLDEELAPGNQTQLLPIIFTRITLLVVPDFLQRFFQQFLPHL